MVTDKEFRLLVLNRAAKKRGRMTYREAIERCDLVELGVREWTLLELVEAASTDEDWRQVRFVLVGVRCSLAAYPT